MQAIEDFSRAVELDPDFSEAHGDMGVEFIVLGEMENGARAIRRAIELDPATGIHHSNLAYALLCLNVFSEAEREAQKAVDMDPENAKGHYLLGLLLARHPQTRQRALEHLRVASRALPYAHAAMAQMYRDDGETRLSQMEAAEYLKLRGKAGVF